MPKTRAKKKQHRGASTAPTSRRVSFWKVLLIDIAASVSGLFTALLALSRLIEARTRWRWSYAVAAVTAMGFLVAVVKILRKLAGASDRARAVNPFLQKSTEADLWGRWSLLAAVMASPIVRALMRRLASEDDKSKSQSVVGLLVLDKAKRTGAGYSAMLLSIVTYLIYCRTTGLELRPEVVVLLLGLVLALFLNQHLLAYRLQKGLYGTNEYEAREIIEFIVSHADKADFSDGSGMKEIWPLVQPETQRVIETVDGAEGATI